MSTPGFKAVSKTSPCHSAISRPATALGSRSGSMSPLDWALLKSSVTGFNPRVEVGCQQCGIDLFAAQGLRPELDHHPHMFAKFRTVHGAEAIIHQFVQDFGPASGLRAGRFDQRRVGFLALSACGGDDLDLARKVPVDGAGT